MNLKPIIFAALLFSAPASQLSALPSSATVLADEPLSDAQARRVLDAVATHFGTTSAVLFTEYKAGTVIIKDLGPVDNGHRFEVVRGIDWIREDLPCCM